MSGGGTGTQTAQLNQDNAWAKSQLGTYNSDIGNYMSNVNSTLAAGNPYATTEYLKNQNLQTSSAMNAANNKEQQELRDTARRTGSNTAAIADTQASSARQGQRDLTNYTAGQTNANEDKWLQEQQQLYADQLGGANSEAGVYNTEMTGANDSLNDLTSRQNAEDQMWGSIIGSGIGAIGSLGSAGINKA